MNENSTVKDYMKSKLFFIPTLYIIQGIIYIGTLSVGLLILLTKSTPQLELVMYWSILILIIQIPVTLYLYKLVKQYFINVLDHMSVLKYLSSTIVVFVPVYFLTNLYLQYDVSIFKFLPHLVVFVAIGIGCYMIITYLTDVKTKQLFKAIVNEIKRKKEK